MNMEIMFFNYANPSSLLSKMKVIRKQVKGFEKQKHVASYGFIEIA